MGDKTHELPPELDPAESDRVLQPAEVPREPGAGRHTKDLDDPVVDKAVQP